MSSGQQLDTVDERILALLRADGRRSLASIGKELNLSRSAVQARLRRLERDREILGYAAILRRPMEPGVRAVLSLKLDVRPCRLVLDQLRCWPEVEQCLSLSGPVDALVMVHAATPGELSQLIDRFRSTEGVQDVEAAVVLDEIMLTRMSELSDRGHCPGY